MTMVSKSPPITAGLSSGDALSSAVCSSSLTSVKTLQNSLVSGYNWECMQCQHASYYKCSLIHNSHLNSTNASAAWDIFAMA